MTYEQIRDVRFYPYGKGQVGTFFRLQIFDTHRTDRDGKAILAYRLTQTTDGDRLVIFEGEDFHCSPLHCTDSDETVASLMTFLTLKPGDTDAEYFAKYNVLQTEFCDMYAEDLALEVDRRFHRD